MGGRQNAPGTRSLLPPARCNRRSSVPMVDVLAEVCRRGISVTSQLTLHDSFWTEGFTADGAGWGHGKQCLIWGYPIDGTRKCQQCLEYTGYAERDTVGGAPEQEECPSYPELYAVETGTTIKDLPCLVWTVARMSIPLPKKRFLTQRC